MTDVKMFRTWLLTLLVLCSHALAEEESQWQDYCDADGGQWSCLLNEWAVTSPATNVTNFRRGRVMSLPPTKNYYVTDRIDTPPPPPQGPHHGPHGPHYGPPHGPPFAHPHGPPGAHPHGPPGAHPHGPPRAYYEEWPATPPPPGASKVVNRPPNPYKDQFRPSYEYSPPSQNQPIPVPAPQYPRPGAADRVDEPLPPPPPPPPKRVTETDLYLLTAIEKLVFRVDLMEKRLRKMEESVHYLVAGRDPQPEPCPQEFTRVGTACYHFSGDFLDWKSANLRCRKLKANLLEFQSDEERRQIHSALLADKKRRGADWWTGGLNPGLLWIWSHTARPVLNETKATSTATQSTNGGIAGEGRCLALAHNPAVSAYVYRGQDCAVKNRYVCEREDDAARLSNEIEKTAKQIENTSGVLKKIETVTQVTTPVETQKKQENTTSAERVDKQVNGVEA